MESLVTNNICFIVWYLKRTKIRVYSVFKKINLIPKLLALHLFLGDSKGI